MKDFNVETLIHGHTHRQAIHDLDLNGTPAQRIVLGDWYEEDCVLIHDETGFRFERVENYIKDRR
jgi:UDP-2,3-diacylglucosamine hydrolase